MKRKLNLILVTVVLALAGSAYGLCYLEQVVLCAASGDSLGNASVVWLPADTSIGGNFTLYADESAYKIDTYSVSRGFNRSSQETCYCDNWGSIGNEFPVGQGGGSWQLHYYNNNTAATGTSYGLISPTHYNYATTRYETTGTTCP